MATRELSILTDDGVVLSGEDAGEEAAPAIVLLHGLTATRRYVVMGSRLLERSGYRVIAYDARGHGRSTPPVVPGGQPAGEAAYGYARLARDLEAVLDALELPRAALAGASMGAHTSPSLRARPPRAGGGAGARDAGLRPRGERRWPRWHGRSARRGSSSHPKAIATCSPGRCARVGWRRSCAPTTSPPCSPRGGRPWRRVVSQRLSLHEHPAAVADAMEVVSRSRPFEDFAELAAIAVPTVVVASPRRGRSRAPARVGRALRAGDPRRDAHRRGRRAAPAFPDRVAGGPALEGARGALGRAGGE